jgi:transposase
MTKRIMFVGMDLHQHSIDLTVAESGHDGAVTHVASIGGDLPALDGAVATLRRRGAALHFVYEAGPCGYTIDRHLRQAGLAGAVVAPAQVPKKAADRVKTDRRDARTLAVQNAPGRCGRSPCPTRTMRRCAIWCGRARTERQPHDGIETGGSQPADISSVQSSFAMRPARRGR